MKMMTRENIDNGLAMNGAIAGKLPNMRQVNPTLAINKEISMLIEEDNKGTIIVEKHNALIASIPNVDDCVEVITEDVEWVNESFDLVYGEAYEGGIRYTERLEPLMTW